MTSAVILVRRGDEGIIFGMIAETSASIFLIIHVAFFFEDSLPPILCRRCQYFPSHVSSYLKKFFIFILLFSTLVSPLRLVMPFASRYSKIATANFRLV